MSLCNVCNINESVGVGASTCGPISFAYCRSCLQVHAEPYFALVAYLSAAVSRGTSLAPEANEIMPGYQDIIDASLKVAGKTREEFYADVDDAIKDYDEHIAQLENNDIE